MIVQLSILCVTAIWGHPFIKLPLLFKNVLNMCMSSALYGSNKAKKHSFTAINVKLEAEKLL